jgi:hypothetical protein
MFKKMYGLKAESQETDQKITKAKANENVKELNSKV